MSSQTVVLSTPEGREMLAALDALGGPEAVEATDALIDAYFRAKPEIHLELTGARRRLLDSALDAHEARLRAGDLTAAATYERFARTVTGTRARLEDCPLAAIA